MKQDPERKNGFINCFRQAVTSNLQDLVRIKPKPVMSPGKLQLVIKVLEFGCYLYPTQQTQKDLQDNIANVAEEVNKASTSRTEWCMVSLKNA